MKIKDAIKEMGMSKTEIAYNLKVSYETVKKWEKNDRIPESPASILFWMLYEQITGKESDNAEKRSFDRR